MMKHNSRKIARFLTCASGAGCAMGLLVMTLVSVASAADTRQSITPVQFSNKFGTFLTGYLLRPERKAGAAAAQYPAVIALHGCGGVLNRKTGGLSARHRAWAKRLVAEGFVVLFPASFGSRGFGSLCRMKPRPVKTKLRRFDVDAARRWLKKQSFVAEDQISVLGWSNGGSTALRVAAAKSGRHYNKIIAFYPGCRAFLKKRRRSKTPLKILIGAADDWTPVEPCLELATNWDIRIVVYEGAYHGFDTPGRKLRRRRGMAYSKNGDGVVHVGTNEAARKKAIAEVLRTLKN